MYRPLAIWVLVLPVISAFRTSYSLFVRGFSKCFSFVKLNPLLIRHIFSIKLLESMDFDIYPAAPRSRAFFL